MLIKCHQLPPLHRHTCPLQIQCHAFNLVVHFSAVPFPGRLLWGFSNYAEQHFTSIIPATDRQIDRQLWLNSRWLLSILKPKPITLNLYLSKLSSTCGRCLGRLRLQRQPGCLLIRRSVVRLQAPLQPPCRSISEHRRCELQTAPRCCVIIV